MRGGLNTTLPYESGMLLLSFAVPLTLVLASQEAAFASYAGECGDQRLIVPGPFECQADEKPYLQIQLTPDSITELGALAATNQSDLVVGGDNHNLLFFPANGMSPRPTTSP